MRPKRRQRLLLVCGLVGAMSLSAALIARAFSENLMFFFSPSEVAAGESPINRPFRIGGLVKPDSVKHASDSLFVEFTLSDGAADVAVRYEGLLPDLFREGQGIIAHGRMNSAGRFEAHEVLAKHDENYMPPEVAEALSRVESSSLLPDANGVRIDVD